MNHFFKRLWPFVFFGAAGCAAPAVVFVSPNYNAKDFNQVAVLDFTDYPGDSGSGDVVADIFEPYLIPLGYNLIERQQVDQILQEQNFDVSGAVDLSTIQSAGKLLGADALIIGSVTDYTQSSEQTVMVDMPQESVQPIYTDPPPRGGGNRGGGGGGGGRSGGNGGGRVMGGGPVVSGYVTTETDNYVPQTETLPASIGISVRMVSVQTGTLLWSGTAQGDGSDVSDAATEASQSLAEGLKSALAKLGPAAAAAAAN